MGRVSPALSQAALACALALIHFVHASPSRAAGPARWTPPVNWAAPGSNAYAVHMVLMAGDGAPHHSRILWFRGHGGSGLQGGEWGWTPPTASHVHGSSR